MHAIMTEIPSPSTDDFAPHADLASAFAWWQEAGVTLDFAEDTQNWLEEPPSPEEAPQPKAKGAPAKTPLKTNALERALKPSSAGPIGGDAASWPKDLDGFRKFWLEDPALPGPQTERRIAPRGAQNAALMLLTAQPDDADAGQLFSGNQGKMLSAIIRACGLSADEDIYFASTLPSVTAMPDWQDLGVRGLGKLTRHHISLAAPKRVLVFGRSLSGVLECAADRAEVGDIPLMIAPSLENLARSSSRRARFWDNWLDWTA